MPDSNQTPVERRNGIAPEPEASEDAATREARWRHAARADSVASLMAECGAPNGNPCFRLGTDGPEVAGCMAATVYADCDHGSGRACEVLAEWMRDGALRCLRGCDDGLLLQITPHGIEENTSTRRAVERCRADRHDAPAEDRFLDGEGAPT